MSLSKEVHTVDGFRTPRHPAPHQTGTSPGPKHNADAKNASADSKSNGSQIEIMLMLQPNLQELLCSKLEGPASMPRSSVNGTSSAARDTAHKIVSACTEFNADNVGFDNIGCYTVSIRVARTLPTVEVYSQNLTPVDYHVMGDIMAHLTGVTWNFDIRHCGLLTVGVLSNINRDDLTLTINAQQYVTVMKALETFPVQCLIPDSEKFKNYKPIPAKVEFIQARLPHRKHVH
ncbi:hypothetical protein B0H14DRAFT_2596727 [Mycena olivaceomarginata]|nr:hypothetical protein B0H14DRAFT_2596727 [Mycena olivaceomarginata]